MILEIGLLRDYYLLPNLEVNSMMCQIYQFICQYDFIVHSNGF